MAHASPRPDLLSEEAQDFTLAEWRVRPSLNLLSCDGREFRLEPKVMQLLVYLARHAGQAVSKEELIRAVWADTFVTDQVLTNAIWQLRHALGDKSAAEARFIQTIPKLGYRLIAPVIAAPAGGLQLLEPPPSRLRKLVRRAAPAAAAVVVALAVLLLWNPANLRSRLQDRLWPRPPLTERDTIVLADFTNTTGDPVFDDALQQALRIKLEQSPSFSVLSSERVSEILHEMGRPAGHGVTGESGRELCLRAGSKLLVEGSIAAAGEQYVVGLTAFDCATGNRLAEEQQITAGKENILPALDQASARLRLSLGESRGSIQAFDVPLEHATTPSFEALQAYSVGVRKMHELGAYAGVPFWKRAIELDPNFASAYVPLGHQHWLNGHEALAMDSLQKAYALRDRVTQKERFNIVGAYHRIVTGDLVQSLEAYELAAQTYPREADFHHQLGFTYRMLGQHDSAAKEERACLQLAPEDSGCLEDLVLCDYFLGRLDDAKAEYRKAAAVSPEDVALHLRRWTIAFLESDLPERQRQLAWARNRPELEGFLSFLLQRESAAEAYAGRVKNARLLAQQAERAARGSGVVWPEPLLSRSLWEAEVGNLAEAHRLVMTQLQTAGVGRLRGRPTTAFVLAYTGDANRARALADDMARRYPSDTRVNHYWLPVIRATIAIHAGRPSEAIELLETATPYELGDYMQAELLPPYVRGQAFLALGRGSAAAAEFQKILDHPGIVRASPIGAIARLQLGRAYVLQGDAAKARTEYQNFLTLWKDADPDIPVLRQAKAEFARLPATP